MAEQVHDLAVVGGGPSGLMCGLTGVTGIPINPPRHFKGIILDGHEMASFARYGKLRLTHRWHYNGGKLSRFLEDEVAQSNLVLRPHTRVLGVDLAGEIKRLETSTGTILARTVALCTGFFPYGFLARTPQQIRISFSPASVEAPHLPATPGARVGILGRGQATVDFACALRERRPDVTFELLLDDESVGDVDFALHYGEPTRFRTEAGGVEVALQSPRSVESWQGDFLLVDYDAYTRSTPVTGFLAGSGVTLKSGYIVVNRMGETGLPGVVAAGNIVTPVSGVLTALDTGYHAGLAIYETLHQERFGTAPLVFPWLPRTGLADHPLVRGQEEE